MKNTKNYMAVTMLLIVTVLFTSCGNNSKKDNSSGSNSAEIPGVYSGIYNVGMESTITLRSGGTLIIKASVGDGTPDYGNWTGTADNLSLYHKDSYGNDELIGNAKVTESGLKIIGGKFYSRQ